MLSQQSSWGMRKSFIFMLGQHSSRNTRKIFFGKKFFFRVDFFVLPAWSCKIYQVAPVFTTNFLSVCLFSETPSIY